MDYKIADNGGFDKSIVIDEEIKANIPQNQAGDTQIQNLFNTAY